MSLKIGDTGGARRTQEELGKAISGYFGVSWGPLGSSGPLVGFLFALLLKLTIKVLNLASQDLLWGLQVLFYGL